MDGRTEEWLAVEWQDGREEEKEEKEAGTKQKEEEESGKR